MSLPRRRPIFCASRRRKCLTGSAHVSAFAALCTARYSQSRSLSAERFLEPHGIRIDADDFRMHSAALALLEECGRLRHHRAVTHRHDAREAPWWRFALADSCAFGMAYTQLPRPTSSAGSPSSIYLWDSTPSRVWVRQQPCTALIWRTPKGCTQLLIRAYVCGRRPGSWLHQRVGAPLRRVAGRLATAPAWTAVEAGAKALRRPRTLAMLDAALRSMRCTRAELESAVREQKGRRGIVHVRDLVDYADGRAESGMESEARLVMIFYDGLPLPQLQYEIHGHSGEAGASILRGPSNGWPRNTRVLNGMQADSRC